MPVLEDKMQEEIEVLAQNFVNEVNEVNISWNKEFFASTLWMVC